MIKLTHRTLQKRGVTVLVTCMLSAPNEARKTEPFTQLLILPPLSQLTLRAGRRRQTLRQGLVQVANVVLFKDCWPSRPISASLKFRTSLYTTEITPPSPLGLPVIFRHIVGQTVQDENLAPLRALIQGCEQFVNRLGVEIQ